MARLLSHLQQDRQDADCLVGAVFTDDDAATIVADAERFVEAVRALLQQGHNV